MGKRWRLASVVLAVTLTPALASAADPTLVIRGSQHDFSGWTPNGSLCIACHSQHSHTVPYSSLIWNHVLSTSNFGWSDATATTGGTVLPTNIKTSSGSTKYCLSCHDGTVDIGALIDPPVDYNGSKIPPVALIGPDLKGHHPVGVPYPFNQMANMYNGILSGDAVPATEYVAAPTKVRLYSDPAVPAPANHGIECGSCHDPHGTGIAEFLRDSILGSALCLDCHVK